MCLAHWKLASPADQERVYKYYQRGQCSGSKIPSEEWHMAADVVIYRIAFNESQWLYARALKKMKEAGIDFDSVSELKDLHSKIADAAKPPTQRGSS